MVIKSRRLRWAGHVARMEEGRRAYRILTGKPTRKRALSLPRRRWEDNIRMDLEEMGINAGNWVDSAQDRDYCRTCGFHKPWSLLELWRGRFTIPVMPAQASEDPKSSLFEYNQQLK